MNFLHWLAGNKHKIRVFNNFLDLCTKSVSRRVSQPFILNDTHGRFLSEWTYLPRIIFAGSCTAMHIPPKVLIWLLLPGLCLSSWALFVPLLSWSLTYSLGYTFLRDSGSRFSIQLLVQIPQDCLTFQCSLLQVSIFVQSQIMALLLEFACLVVALLW